MTEHEAKRAIIDIGRRLYARNMVAGNDGNISVRLSDGRIICTPTLVSKGFMSEAEICVLDYTGKQISGSLNPTSEIKMHIGIYNENSEINGIVHAHPITATAFAAKGLGLIESFLAEAVSEPGPVPLAPFAEPGTDEVSDSVVPYCRKFNACLLEKHGALSWGKDVFSAYMRMEKLEHNAQIYILAKYLQKDTKEQ